jgi:hypothetical protein
MTTNKHMVNDPTFQATELTEGGKAAGRMPPAPVVLSIRGNDVLAADRAVIVTSEHPLKAAIEHLKAAGLDPFTHVSVYVDGHLVRLADGRLKDLA